MYLYEQFKVYDIFFLYIYVTPDVILALINKQISKSINHSLIGNK